jgi:phosphoglycerate dehydrogenase-like enzyme
VSAGSGYADGSRPVGLRVHVADPGASSGPATREQLENVVTSAGARVVPLPDAQALVWPDWSDPQGLSRAVTAAPALTWVQLVTAGVDSVQPALDPRLCWTSAKGAYSEPIAEHVLGVLLACLRDLPGYARARTWQPRPAGTLRGARVTVVGGGGIAAALLRLLAPFGCATTVVRRSGAPLAGADEVVTPEALPRVAARSDVLVLALALTPETRHLVDAALLARLPRSAWVVNVSRGEHVDTAALADALDSGRIAGAALDVTDPEPLPPDAPLWSNERCLLTPHVACPPRLARPYLLERLGDNVRRRSDGLPLVGVVDPLLGY